jgi:recombination protein RecA
MSGASLPLSGAIGLPLETSARGTARPVPASSPKAEALASMPLPRGVTRGATALAPLPASPVAVPLTPRWDLQEIAGRLTELSGQGGSACLTLATSMVVDAQRQAETAAWITGNNSSFFPLDVAAAGVDLEALSVVRVPDASAVARAADKLARSGAFGLLVLDLGANPRVSAALQARLRSLARKHDTAILCLTEKASSASSLGSLVSLRAEARIRRLDDDRFACELRVLKDKQRGPGWVHTEICTGPDGFF